MRELLLICPEGVDDVQHAFHSVGTWFIARETAVSHYDPLISFPSVTGLVSVGIIAVLQYYPVI